MIRAIKQAMPKHPDMPAAISPTLALAMTSLVLLSVSEDEAAAAAVVVAAAVAAAELLLVLVVVYVVSVPALVVVIVRVTIVSVDPALKNSASDTSNGVFVCEQDSCSKSQTVVRIVSPWFAMHMAVLMTKFPVLPHRHRFSSATVSPAQPEMPAASSRHD